MKVRIKKMDGSAFEIELEAEALVGSLKMLIGEHESVEESRLRLIYRGQVLSNDMSLASSHIEEGGTVHLVLRPGNFPHRGADGGIESISSTPVLHSPSEPFVQHTPILVTGPAIGSVNPVRPEDLGALFSQLFSTIGSAEAPARPEAPPSRVSVAATSSPPPISTLNFSDRYSSHSAHLQAHIERVVVNAEVIMDAVADGRAFSRPAATDPTSSLFSHVAPSLDIHANNHSAAVGQAVSILSDAMSSMHPIINRSVENFRTCDPQSSHQRISLQRETEQLRYILSRLGLAAVAAADALDCLNVVNSRLWEEQMRSSSANTRSMQSGMPTVAEAGNNVRPDDGSDRDAGLSLPAMDSAGVDRSAHLPQQRSLEFLNSVIPSVLNTAVGLFSSQSQSSGSPPINSVSLAAITRANNSLEGCLGQPSSSEATAAPPTTSMTEQHQTEQERVRGVDVHFISDSSTNSNATQLHSASGRNQQDISNANDSRQRRVVYHIHRRVGETPGDRQPGTNIPGVIFRSSPVRPPFLSSSGVRFVQHHTATSGHNAPNPIHMLPTAEASVVGSSTPNRSIGGHHNTSSEIRNESMVSTPIAVAVNGSEQSPHGIGHNSLPQWVQQQMYQSGLNRRTGPSSNAGRRQPSQQPHPGVDATSSPRRTPSVSTDNTGDATATNTTLL